MNAEHYHELAFDFCTKVEEAENISQLLNAVIDY